MTIITATPHRTETQVVIIEEGKTAAQKVLELPQGSIVAIRVRPRAPIGHLLGTVLHRTGEDGWRVTRAVDNLDGGRYHNNHRIDALLQRYEAEGATFHLLGEL